MSRKRLSSCILIDHLQNRINFSFDFDFAGLKSFCATARRCPSFVLDYLRMSPECSEIFECFTIHRFSPPEVKNAYKLILAAYFNDCF